MFYVNFVNDAGCVLSTEKFDNMDAARAYIVAEILPTLCIGDSINIVEA